MTALPTVRRILRSYEQADSRVSVISKANGGLSSARNAGIDGSHGEYLFFLLTVMIG